MSQRLRAVESAVMVGGEQPVVRSPPPGYMRMICSYRLPWHCKPYRVGLMQEGSLGRVSMSPALEGIIFSLLWEVWQGCLKSHPDGEYVDYLVRDLWNGL